MSTEKPALPDIAGVHAISRGTYCHQGRTIKPVHPFRAGPSTKAGDHRSPFSNFYGRIYLQQTLSSQSRIQCRPYAVVERTGAAYFFSGSITFIKPATCLKCRHQ